MAYPALEGRKGVVAMAAEVSLKLDVEEDLALVDPQEKEEDADNLEALESQLPLDVLLRPQEPLCLLKPLRQPVLQATHVPSEAMTLISYLEMEVQPGKKLNLKNVFFYFSVSKIALAVCSCSVRKRTRERERERDA